VEGEKQNSVSNVAMGGSRSTAEEVTWRRPKSRFGSLRSALLACFLSFHETGIVV
jgi:hypothetical protein